MPKSLKNSVVADKAWNLFRLALLWARKVAVLKSKAKGVGDKAHSDQIHYLERQLSFDKTPDLQHLKKDRLAGSMRFLFPCISAKEVEFQYGLAADDEEKEEKKEEEGGVKGNDSRRESFSTEEEHEDDDEYEYKGCEQKIQLEEEGIDSRAEKFIAEFYGQIKFQN